MNNFDIIVIGGGASGMIAAISAAKNNKKVALIEKMKFPGLKLGLTGKGRCNITNTASGFTKKINPDGKFMENIYARFSSKDLIEYLHGVGIGVVMERGGRVFPENIKAVEFAKALKSQCLKHNVELICNFKVTRLIISDKQIKGVKGIKNNKPLSCFAGKVIIATGGKSYPLTGSTGDGYMLAKHAGHSVTKLFPALVPLKSDIKIIKQLNGLQLKNISCSLYINDKIVVEKFGEVHFRDNTVTGPVILSISRTVVESLMEKSKVKLILNLKPALNKTKLENRIKREIENNKKHNIRTLLNKLLPSKLIPLCIEQSKLPERKPAELMTKHETGKLISWLHNFEIPVFDYCSYNEAIITAGGINTNELSNITLESKIVRGLYFAGEILNLDAPTGGYNLQIAFSTGWVAGLSAATT